MINVIQYEYDKSRVFSSGEFTTRKLDSRPNALKFSMSFFFCIWHHKINQIIRTRIFVFKKIMKKTESEKVGRKVHKVFFFGYDSSLFFFSSASFVVGTTLWISRFFSSTCSFKLLSCHMTFKDLWEIWCSDNYIFQIFSVYFPSPTFNYGKLEIDSVSASYDTTRLKQSCNNGEAWIQAAYPYYIILCLET